jgi:hypothetical protein
VLDFVRTRKHGSCLYIAIVEAGNVLISLLFWLVLDTQSVPGTGGAMVVRSV